MAITEVTSTGDGSTTDFSIPSQYLDESYVKATVDGVAASFTFISSSMIRFDTAPANGTTVRRYRETPTDPLVDFSDVSQLTETDLDTAILQALHVAEETVNAAPGTADDQIAAAVGVTVQAYSAILAATTASFTTALKSKLDGIASGATVNASDAALRDRSTHTGSQSSSSISDFNTSADARADARISAASGSSIQPHSSILSDTTASFTTDLKTKLDGVGAGATANASDASLRDRSTHTGNQLAATISDFSTSVDARIGVSLPGLGVANTFTENLTVNPGAAASIIYLQQTGPGANAWEIKNNQNTGRFSLGITGGTDPVKIVPDAVENCLRIGFTATNVCDFAGPIKLPNYMVATLPAASVATGCTVYVTDEAGGAVIASSDGTNWRRSTDRAVVS